MSLIDKLKLQVALAKPGIFVLDQSRLDQELLGGQAADNSLFVLDQSRLDVDLLATEGNDPNTQWVDVMGQARSITARRGADRTEVGSEFRTGTMNISFIGPALDPHQNALIVPGVPVRLITTAGTVVFRGAIRRAWTDYDKPDIGENGTVRVNITVLDPGQRLANIMRYGIVGGSFSNRVDELLGKHSIPYNRLGTGGGVDLARTDYESTLLNHLQMAADSAGGWFYVDRAGVVQIGPSGTAPTAPVMKFSSRKSTDPSVLSYTELRYLFDDSAIVNELTLSNRYWGLNTQGQEEGLTKDTRYSEPISVATYGTVRAGLDTNLLNQSDQDALAQSLLNKYSRPSNHVASLTFVATNEVERAAALEPYQVVTVHFANKYFEETDNHRILNIEHQIKGDQWFTTLELERV